MVFFVSAICLQILIQYLKGINTFIPQMFCKKILQKNSAKSTGKHVYRSFSDKVASLADFGKSVFLSTWWISPSHFNFIFPYKLTFLARCVQLPSSMLTVSTKFSKFFNSIFNGCNHLVVNPRLRVCLYEKNIPARARTTGCLPRRYRT